MHIHEGRRLRLDWLQAVAPDNQVEIDAISADRDGIVATYGRWPTAAPTVIPDEPIVSIPVRYTAHPVRRDSAES